MGLPADDVMARLLRHRMDRRRTGEVVELEERSIRLLCELALAAVAQAKRHGDQCVCDVCSCVREIDAAGLLPEEGK
uniref:Uncharacterized protein n=1 Tax=viral metagenome TaxID=1070528 RepID=A0A6H1ZR98_9ZZZZ